MANLDEQSVIIACGYEGTTEEGGNNRGPMVDKFIEAVGLNPPEPWCCGFICYCIQQAVQQLGLPPPTFQYGASVLKLWDRNQSLVIPAPVANCIALRNEGVNSLGHAVGHALFVIGVNADGSLHCISGNTNAAGSRDGNCVAIQDRPMSQFANGYGFLKIE